MDIHKIIKHFGGTPKVCKALGVTKGAVSQWRQDGIPLLRQYQIEVLTGGKFTAARNRKAAA